MLEFCFPFATNFNLTCTRLTKTATNRTQRYDECIGCMQLMLSGMLSNISIFKYFKLVQHAAEKDRVEYRAGTRDEIISDLRVESLKWIGDLEKKNTSDSSKHSLLTPFLFPFLLTSSIFFRLLSHRTFGLVYSGLVCPKSSSKINFADFSMFKCKHQIFD